MKTTWDRPGIIEALEDFVAAGMTSSEIARALERKFSLRGVISRNAVIGKVHRLGLSLSGGPTHEGTIPPRKPKPARVVVIRKPKPPRKPEVPPMPDEPKPLGPKNDLADFGTCRWIHGDVRDGKWRMCGHPIVNRSSYCAHHLARTLNPQKKPMVEAA